MKIKTLVLFTLTLTALIPAAVLAAPPTTVDIANFEKLAKAGDAKAMTTLGLIYQQGEGVKQDYERAYEWYLKAMAKGDGDAFNNIGVMFRDGLGVEPNLKVAYLIFLAVHMEGMGNSDTQTRAGRNFDRVAHNLPDKDLYEALSYTWPYVLQIIKSRGQNLKIGADVLPAKGRPRIRDNNWWTDAERAGMKFASPPPWNKKG
jgi:hypothetical protein